MDFISDTAAIAAPLELKFAPTTGVFEGYAAVFHNVDSAGDRILPGAFTASLAACRRDGRFPPLLWQHDPKRVIGIWEDMHEDSSGLYVRGRLFTDDITQAREAYTLLKENVVSGLSIGYRTVESQRDGKTGVRLLAELELLEVSIVTFPANDRARVRAVKSQITAGMLPAEKDVEAHLRDAGLSRRQAKALMAHGYKALAARDAMDGDDTADDAALLARLAARIRALT
jgi:HK97 family phage prohead protease